MSKDFTKVLKSATKLQDRLAAAKTPAPALAKILKELETIKTKRQELKDRKATLMGDLSTLVKSLKSASAPKPNAKEAGASPKASAPGKAQAADKSPAKAPTKAGTKA